MSDIPLVLDSETTDQQRSIATRVGLTMMEEPPGRERYFLKSSDDRLTLCGPAFEVAIDFAREKRHHHGSARRQPLARAIGPSPRSVFDATVGLGRDAFHLAAIGYHVIGYEREPAIAALLFDALDRAGQVPELSSILSRLDLRFGDAQLELSDASAFTSDRPDTIYVDPMYPPPRKAKALPKKEMQALRAVVTTPSDDGTLDELLARARAVARDRVVLKRPTHVAPRPGVRHRVESKLVCYDVFAADPPAPE